MANEAAETVERRGREQLTRVKEEAADRADRAADAVEQTAEQISDRGDGGEAIAGYGHSMASFMRRMAGGLREQDLDEFASELSDYARRNPGMFLAGSVALGFGISRFLKASASRSEDARYDLGLEDDYESDDSDEEYDYEAALRPSPSPEVSPRALTERWPSDSEDRAATSAAPGPDPSTSMGPSRADTTNPAPTSDWAPGAKRRPDADRNLTQGDENRG